MLNITFGTGITNWLSGHNFEFVKIVGEGEERVIIIRRDDGMLAAETNAEPLWDDDCQVLLDLDEPLPGLFSSPTSDEDPS